MAAGCQAAFVARPGMGLTPIGRQPDIVGADLAEVVEQIVAGEVECRSAPERTSTTCTRASEASALLGHHRRVAFQPEQLAALELAVHSRQALTAAFPQVGAQLRSAGGI